MAEISAAGDSHVGQVRGGNEDALLVGANVFAVADGMGGHVAGEVASQTALGPVAQLDGKVFASGQEARGALRAAVQKANDNVLDRAEGDPELRGMGTTLTVAMVEGRRVHIAHVGDSRAYLLRGEQLSRLTQDHTLVQDLIDEGQITPEEAASHPQRSIVTRAIGVAANLHVDVTSLQLRPGDRILLCSDGLTNVIGDDELATELERAGELDAAVDQLIDWANDRGGPDNITAVALGFDTDHIGESVARTTGELTPIAPAEPAGASPGGGGPASGDTSGGDSDGDSDGGGPVRVRTRPDGESRDWAGRLGRIGALSTGSRRGRRRSGRSRKARIAAVLAAVVLLVAGLAGLAWWQLSRSYFVGLSGEQLVVYAGVPGDLGPVDLQWVHEETGVSADEVPAHLLDDLERGVLAANPEDARRIVDNAERKGRQQQAERTSDQQATGSSRQQAGARDGQQTTSPRGADASP